MQPEQCWEELWTLCLWVGPETSHVKINTNYFRFSSAYELILFCLPVNIFSPRSSALGGDLHRTYVSSSEDYNFDEYEAENIDLKQESKSNG